MTKMSFYREHVIYKSVTMAKLLPKFNTKLIITLLCLILSIMYHNQSFADQSQNSRQIKPEYQKQTQNYQGKWWINLGVGIGAAEHLNNPVLSTEISGNYMTTPHQLLTVRAIGATDLKAEYGNMALFPFCGLFGTDPNNCTIKEGYVNDFSALYGYIRKNENGYISASVGIGYTSTRKTQVGKIAAPHRSTVGLPIEIQSFWTPFKYFGIGLIGAANINANQPSVAGLLAIQFGNLK